MSLPNVWHHRRVADTAAKACWICYKPSTSVLITPDNKDFFYVCVGHLKDRGFAQPDADEAAAVAARQKQAELEREIENVKKEYEERQRKRREKKKGKEGKKDEKSKDEKGKKDEEEEERKDEKEKDEKIKALSKQESKDEEEGPRIYTLQKSFYQMRLDRIRNAEQARRNRERLKNPANFPSVPSGDL